MSQTFHDATGRPWVVHLTVGLLGRVRRETGLELGKVLGDEHALASLLFADPENFVKILYVVCDPAKAGVDPESFADGFDGETIGRATGALMAGVADFFRKPRTAGAIQACLAEVETTADSLTEQAIRSMSNEARGNSPGSPASPTPAP